MKFAERDDEKCSCGFVVHVALVGGTYLGSDA
jgi:hypothetical protein